jgi:hypothetical protein
MSFEDYSVIEDFRLAYHGNDTLRLLERKEGGKSYKTVIVLTKGFFIGAEDATAENQRKEVLTIELRYSPGLTRSMLEGRVIALDLVAPDNSFRRYSFGSKTAQSFTGTRYVSVINAAFNDTNLIEL